MMPFHIDTGGPYFRLVLEGRINGADLLAVVTELERLEEGLARVPDRVIDLSDIAIDTNFANVLEVASRRIVRTFPNSFRSAVVAPTPTSLGFARMFQTLNTNPQIEVRIFDTRESAEAWLTGGQ